MNITKAFIERNRLKKYINQISLLLQSTPVFHDKDVENVNLKMTDGKTIDELLKEVLEAKDYLGQFNYAIDVANIKGSRKALDKLETVKAQITSVQEILRKAKSVKTVDVVVSENGTLLKREFEIDVDIKKLSEVLKILQKEERDLEDQISTLNASTEVELNEDLKKYLENYNN